MRTQLSAADEDGRGNNAGRVIESILGTWMSQNLSRDSDSLKQYYGNINNTRGLFQRDDSLYSTKSLKAALALILPPYHVIGTSKMLPLK